MDRVAPAVLVVGSNPARVFAVDARPVSFQASRVLDKPVPFGGVWRNVVSRRSEPSIAVTVPLWGCYGANPPTSQHSTKRLQADCTQGDDLI